MVGFGFNGSCMVRDKRIFQAGSKAKADSPTPAPLIDLKTQNTLRTNSSPHDPPSEPQAGLPHDRHHGCI